MRMLKNITLALLVALGAGSAFGQTEALRNTFRLKDIINITDPTYSGGAKCDGTTNDRAAIDAAATAAAALTGGGTIIVPGGGTCVISTSLTISSSVTVRVERGGRLAPASAQTLTINGSVEAGNYQVFSGDGTIVIGSAGVEVNPLWWGASTSASAATNLSAINASIAATHANGQWRLPHGSYNVTGKIAFAKAFGYATFTFEGGLISDAAADGIEFAEDFLNSKLHIRSLYTRAADFVSAPTYSTVYANARKGVHSLKNFSNNIVEIGYVSGWETGLYLDPTNAAVQKNTVTWINRMENNKYDLRFRSTASPTDSYVSNNTFINFDCAIVDANARTAAGGNDWCVYMDAQAFPPTAITFITPTLQAKTNGIYGVGSNGWVVQAPYTELSTITYVFDVRSSYNFMILGGTHNPDIADLGTKMRVDSGTKGFLCLGCAYTLAGNKNGVLTGTVVDPLASQYQPRANAWGDERVDLVYNYSQYNAYSVQTWQQPNNIQVFNKQSAASAAPTDNGETWSSNAIVWNTNTAVGQPIFWTTGATFGTTGTLNGGATTANTTSGSNDIVVSSVTGLTTGQIVTVAGAGGMTGRIITGIAGTTVTLSGAVAAATTSAQAVSFANPTWRAGPTYP